MDVATHPPTSLRAFARLAGVNDKAVRKAIENGRMRESIGRDEKGRPFVADVELGLSEWEKNRGRSAPPAAQPAKGSQLVDAQRDVSIERARKLRLENDLEEGRLVEAQLAGREAFESARIIREALLNLPARLSAELAAEPDPGKVYLRLDTAIREVLSETADALLKTGTE